MADDPKAQNSNETETEERVVIEINSIDDIASHIQSTLDGGEPATAARSYTAKGGFKSIEALINTPAAILATLMGGAAYALAQQASDGDEDAQECLNLGIAYAQNVGELTSNMSSLNNYAATALLIDGDSRDVSEVPVDEKVKIVAAFIEGLPAAKQKNVPASFSKWLKAQTA